MITEQQQNEVFAEAVCGNQAALAFILEYLAIAHIWDDLIDKDKELSDWDINFALWRALVNLPRNPFYRQHFDVLSQSIEAGIQSWWLSNQLEGQPGQLGEAGNVLRCRAFDLVLKCASITGGIKHAHDIAPKVAAVCYDEPIEHKEVK